VPLSDFSCNTCGLRPRLALAYSSMGAITGIGNRFQTFMSRGGLPAARGRGGRPRGGARGTRGGSPKGWPAGERMSTIAA